MTKLRITHIDAGVDPLTAEDLAGLVFEDQLSGRWPKVSFSDGSTLSYLLLTNTKVLFLTARGRDMIVDHNYNDLVLEFLKSPRHYADSNWRTQKKRVTEWKPCDIELGKKILA